MKEDSRMDIEEIRSLALKHILWSFSAINLMYGSDFAGVNFFFFGNFQKLYIEHRPQKSFMNKMKTVSAALQRHFRED